MSTRSRFAHRTNEELLLQTPQDADAFGAFYDRLEADMLRFFVRATGRGDLAADLTAEVFAAALESVATYRPELGSARAWLFGIARHELADLWERGRVEDQARRRLGVEPLVLVDEAVERIEALTEDPAESLALLVTLPPDQRAAVEGRVLHERDYGELAESLSCSQSVIRQRVSRGLRTLRQRLEQRP